MEHFACISDSRYWNLHCWVSAIYPLDHVLGTAGPRADLLPSLEPLEEKIMAKCFWTALLVFAVTSSASAQRTPSYFPMQLGHNASLYPLSYLLNPGPPRIPTTKRLQGFGAFYFQFLKISRSRAVLELFDKSETPVATAELKLNEEPKAASFVYRI